ncbi:MULTISPECIES: choice-of-anchor I family protein [Paenibacillus]|uniref:choice-of-anchor I family protein n=1 Tax=Paenibacillus TaxID=44249 RepID=UPI002FE10192
MKLRIVRMISLLMAAEILLSTTVGSVAGAAGTVGATGEAGATETVGAMDAGLMDAGSMDAGMMNAGATDTGVVGADDRGSSLSSSATIGISGTSLPAATVGQFYSVTLDVYGGQAPYTFAAAGLPAGLAISDTTRAIEGMPASGAEGNYTVTFTIKDANSTEFTDTRELQVNAAGPALSPAPAKDTLRIRKIAGYETGTPNKDGGVAEIVRYNRDNGKFYLVNGSTNPPSIDIVPLTADGRLTKEKSIDVKELAETEGFQFGDLTSLDINAKTRTIAAAVQEAAPDKNGKILVLDYEGNLLTTYEAGIQPDMVKFTSNGEYILTADEGEPREAGIDPEGSVTIIDLETDKVSHVKFDDPAVIDNAVHIRGAADADGNITGPGSKEDAIHDLEPEYIALSGDEKTAYVTLQENNAIAVVNIAERKVTAVHGLGTKDFSDPKNALDLVNDGEIKLETAPFQGMYMPDGIAAYEKDGKTYLLTANEGDATEWGDHRVNSSKISKLKANLDSASPAAQFLSQHGATYDKVEAAGDMGTDSVYMYGARSFSIWDASSAATVTTQVYDSGSDFERITAERLPDYFNVSNSKVEKDDRSPKKGPEPEYVTVGQVGTKAFAFIGLERVGGVMTYDITNPENPVFVNYTNTRDFPAGINTDTGPEGLEFIPATDSPTGRPLLLVANEVGGTVSVLELDVTKVSLNKNSLRLQAGGGGEQLTATVESAESNSNRVTWSSSRPDIAKVDGDGNVTPVAEGQAVITALSEDGYGVAQAVVTVGSGGQATWELTVMHTNDTHAHLADVARRATLVKQVRAEGGNSLLLDAGDVFSGDLYFTKWQGLADLEFMNYMGYDAMTFGNHEFDKGTKVLADFVKKAKFPLVSSNVDLRRDANMAPLLKATITVDPKGPKTLDNAGVYPYVVLDVEGQKVAVFGLTTEDTKETSSPGKDVTFRNAAEAAKETVQAIEQDGIDIIIGLSHLGYGRDQELAEAVEGIDLIVGGHTHTRLDQPEIVVDDVHRTPTVIVQANEWGKFLGRVDLVFDSQGTVLTGPGQTTGRLITVDAKVPEDSKAAEILAPLNADLEELKKTVIGTAAVPLDGERKNVRSRETSLGNLIADGMLAKAKQLKNADIALTNGGGIRAPIDQGDITMGELRTVMPFGNTLFVMDVTGQQLKDGLENGISGAKLNDLPGKFPQIAGMKLKWDPAQAVGSRVYDVQILKGSGYVPLNLQATYRMATNSFVANGGDGYASFAAAIASGSYYEDLGYPDYEIFIEHVKSLGGTVAPQVEGRIVEQAKPVSGGGQSGGSSGRVTTPAPSTPPAAQTPGAKLSGDQLQTTQNVNAAGQTITVVSVKSAAVLDNALQAVVGGAADHVTISLPDVNGGVEVRLPVQTLIAGAAKASSTPAVVIETGAGGYRLPLKAVSDSVNKALGTGSGLNPQSLLSISVAPVSAVQLEKLETAAASLGAQAVKGTALEFRSSLIHSGTAKALDGFGADLFSRIVPLPAGASGGGANRVAVQFDEAAGEFRPVPAVSVTWNGQPALELKSPGSGSGVFMIVEHKKEFNDVTGHWAEKEIEAMASRLIIKGTDASHYTPGRQVTRGEFTALLVRSLGLPSAAEANPFTDVSAGGSLAGDIGAAVKFGLVDGEGEGGGTFAPGERLSRAEMAVLLSRAWELAKNGKESTAASGASSGIASLARFADQGAIPAWAAPSVAQLTEQNILKGNAKGQFLPGGYTTRAEAAIVLQRTMRALGLAE